MRRSIALFTRRFLTAVALGSVGVPAAVLAADPAPAVAAPAAPAAPAATSLAVTGKAVAIGVDKRQPQGAGQAFDPSVGALYAWVKVKNLGDASTITMVWKREGKKKLSVTLPVGRSYGWHTWSKKGIGDKDVGAWTVDVLDPSGALLDTLAFEVKAGAEVGLK